MISIEKKIDEIIQLPEADKALLLSSSQEIKKEKGAFLLKEGQLCRHIYFVQQGYLRTFYLKEGKEINLSFSFENNFATDLKSIRSDTPSELFIRAGEAVVLRAFAKEGLFRLYEQSSAIETFGRQVLEQLLMEQEEQTNLFKLYTPAERYGYLEKRRPQLLQRVSLTQISSYLGISRETLSRIRARK